MTREEYFNDLLVKYYEAIRKSVLWRQVKMPEQFPEGEQRRVEHMKLADAVVLEVRRELLAAMKEQSQ